MKYICITACHIILVTDTLGNVMLITSRWGGHWEESESGHSQLGWKSQATPSERHQGRRETELKRAGRCNLLLPPPILLLSYASYHPHHGHASTPPHTIAMIFSNKHFIWPHAKFLVLPKFLRIKYSSRILNHPKSQWPVLTSWNKKPMRHD